MSITFNSAGIAETMNNGVSNVTGADSIITENYTNVVQHGIKIDMSVREKTLSGTPPLTFNSNGTPLLDFLISGNMVQSGTPTPDNPIQPNMCGDLETSGAKAGQFKIPISSAYTTTPVYLGEVETTRRIKKLVLTGKEDCTRSASSLSPNAYCYAFKYSDIGMTDIIYNDENMAKIPYPQYVCSHFKMKPSPSLAQDDDFTSIQDGEIGANTIRRTATGINGTYNKYIILCSSQCTTIDDFKSYLAAQYAAGTPVTIWYVLAKPKTGIVNEPLCKIGDYADTLSMEQAGVTIPTAVGNNTLDVQTTLKPSNISITYKGR